MRPWLALVLALAGCATSASPVVKQAPPPPSAEKPPHGSPTPGHFWRSGHWAWDEDEQLYYWETGRWAETRSGELWIPGYWTRVEDQGEVQGWQWIEPRWEPEPR